MILWQFSLHDSRFDWLLCELAPTFPTQTYPGTVVLYTVRITPLMNSDMTRFPLQFHTQPLDCASQGHRTVSAHPNNTGQHWLNGDGSPLLWRHCPDLLARLHCNKPLVGQQKDAAVIKIPVSEQDSLGRKWKHTLANAICVYGTCGSWLIVHMYMCTYLLPLYFIFMLRICVCILYTSWLPARTHGTHSCVFV